MGFYALFRLLWRPRTIVLALLMGICIFGTGGVDIHALFHGEFRAGHLNLFTLIFSALVGFFLVGLCVGELQYNLLSWTLPKLRRRLISSVLFTGIITAFLITWVYVRGGGSAPWVPIFTSALLWYSMGIVSATEDVPKGLPLNIPPLVLILVGFSINRIVDLYSTHPLLCVLLTMLGASLCLHHIFGVDAVRKKSLVSMKEVMALTRISRRKWRHTGPITGLFNWIRAGEYENFGLRRVGWPARAVVASGIGVVSVAASVYLMESHILAPEYRRAIHAFIPIFPAMCAISLCASECLFLQKGWLYPLSRTQLARLAYWGGLFYPAVVCGILLLTFLVLENLIEVYAGYDFIRPLTLIFIFTPFFQWQLLRYGPGSIGLQIIILSLRSLGHDVFSRGIIAQRLPYLHWMSHQKP